MEMPTELQAGRLLDPETYYSPTKLDYLVHHWDELRGRAEHIGSPSEPRAPVQGGGGGDCDRDARIMGDVLRSVSSLGEGNKPLWLMLLVIYGHWPMERHQFGRDRDWRGYVVRQAGRLLALSSGAAAQMYRDSLRRMARYLGWRSAEDE